MNYKMDTVDKTELKVIATRLDLSENIRVSHLADRLSARLNPALANEILKRVEASCTQAMSLDLETSEYMGPEIKIYLPSYFIDSAKVVGTLLAFTK